MDWTFLLFLASVVANILPPFYLPYYLSDFKISWGDLNAGNPGTSLMNGITLMTTDSSISAQAGYPNTSITYTTDGNIISVDLQGWFGLPPTGPNSTDTILIGDFPGFGAANQSFVLSTIDPDFTSVFGLGLGLGRVGSGQLPPSSSFLESLVSIYGIPQILGAWFSNYPEEQPPPEIQFGGSNVALYDPMAVTTHQMYVPEMLLWNVRGTNVSFSIGSSNLEFNWNGNFVLETSAANIYAPRHIVQAMAQALNWIPWLTVNDQDYYIFQPDTDLATLPDLKLAIDSFVYSIPGTIYGNPNDSSLQRGVRIVGVDLKVGPHPTWILGYPFLITYYSIFDYVANTVSFSLATRFP